MYMYKYRIISDGIMITYCVISNDNMSIRVLRTVLYYTILYCTVLYCIVIVVIIRSPDLT